MFQRLPITLTQVKASNTSENLLSERRQVIYSLHWGKKVKKLLKTYIYNNTMNSIKFIKQNGYYIYEFW